MVVVVGNHHKYTQEGGAAHELLQRINIIIISGHTYILRLLKGGTTN